jgi:predicted  nucleic acid-binding Zn-ribbon protein|tara:strand:- start:810 stop:1079 length:270 start_codon:yes stop_codon:yes gene_type:complete
MDLSTEVKILKDNIRELQHQLNQAHQRIGELVSEKSTNNEEVVKQKQFIQEITNELKKVNSEAEQKIQKEMDDIPSVLDSKPQVLKEGD